MTLPLSEQVKRSFAGETEFRWRIYNFTSIYSFQNFQRVQPADASNPWLLRRFSLNLFIPSGAFLAFTLSPPKFAGGGGLVIGCRRA